MADSELGLLAGGDRIEAPCSATVSVPVTWTLSLALNMYSQGVDPELDFSTCRRS
ncbi:MAG: hypothetical protein ACLSFT_06095 [Ruminococcus callidus]